MPRINLKSGDSGNEPVAFQGATWQQFVSVTNSGSLTLSPHGVSVYVRDSVTGVGPKILDGTTETLPVIGGRNYDVEIAGPGAAPSGTIDYAFV